MYRWVDHTGELELEIEAPSQDAVFGDAFAALAELLADEPGGEPVSRTVEVRASDQATLVA